MANEYRLHSTYVEALRSSPTSDARLYSTYVEALRSAPNADARLASVYVEVVRSVDYIPSSTRRKQAMVGSF